MPRRTRTVARDLIRRLPLWPLAALVVVGLLTAVAFADTPAYQKRLDAFQRKASAARSRLGLDHNQACTRYPTPEMTFDEKVKARPGQTFTVHATGQFVKGTEFVFDDDNVTVVRASTTPTTATVVGRVGKAMMPGSVELMAVSPVCGAQDDAEALEVEATTEWRVTLDNGWKLHLVAEGLGDGPKCTGTWSYRGKTRKLPCALKLSGNGGYEADLGAASDVQDLMNRGMKVMSDPGVLKSQKELGKVVAGMSKCSSLPTDAQMACIKKVNRKMQVLNAKMKAAQDAAMHKAMKGVFGCLEVDLDVQGHAVTAQGNHCGDPASVNGKGTVRLR